MRIHIPRMQFMMMHTWGKIQDCGEGVQPYPFWLCGACAVRSLSSFSCQCSSHQSAACIVSSELTASESSSWSPFFCSALEPSGWAWMVSAHLSFHPSCHSIQQQRKRGYKWPWCLLHGFRNCIKIGVLARDSADQLVSLELTALAELWQESHWHASELTVNAAHSQRVVQLCHLSPWIYPCAYTVQ